MQSFYYYQGDWVQGKTLLTVVVANTIAEADAQFQQEFGIDPRKTQSVTVTLAPISDSSLNRQV